MVKLKISQKTSFIIKGLIDFAKEKRGCEEVHLKLIVVN